MSNKVNFTKAALDALPLPEAGQRATYFDDGGKASVRGLQLRVTATGAKTFSVFHRVKNGGPERVSIGSYPNCTIDYARREAVRVLNELAEGKSPNAQKREQRIEAMTLQRALEDYCAKKRRKKDGLPLKDRTRADYLKMLAPAKVKADGTQSAGGELVALAAKPINQITASMIRSVYDQAQLRGTRRAAYAMQVLRATLNWHGIVISDNPLSKTTAGKHQIQIPQARAGGHAIPAECIGGWWRATAALPESSAKGYLLFTLLTGCRPSEPLQILVSDCDLVGGRVLLRDTKNRSDHTLLLSRQALAIVKQQALGKLPTDRLFDLTDPKKTVRAVVKASGVEFSAKTLRKTFASVAENLVSYSTLKRLLNHSVGADVTLTHYVKLSEAQLRSGWQVVADHVEQLAQASHGNVVQLYEAAA